METPTIVENQKLVKNLLAFKLDLLKSLTSHKMALSTQDVLESLNHCLYDQYPVKEKLK